jgi:pilus assembly protein Flp/PilA
VPSAGLFLKCDGPISTCNGGVTNCERSTADNAGMFIRGLFRRVCRRVRSEQGQGMVEYALILVLIAVVVIVLLIILGNQVANVFCNISGAIGQ